MAGRAASGATCGATMPSSESPSESPTLCLGFVGVKKPRTRHEKMLLSDGDRCQGHRQRKPCPRRPEFFPYLVSWGSAQNELQSAALPLQPAALPVQQRIVLAAPSLPM